MWLFESNRLKHLKYGIYSSFAGTILFTTGLAVGMEFKDKQYGDKFDYYLSHIRVYNSVG